MKPCPFCGEKQDLEPIEMASKGDPEHYLWYIRCEYCGALGPCSGMRQRAKEAWDDRV